MDAPQEHSSVVTGRKETLALHAHGRTDCGLVRENNEDQFLIAERGDHSLLLVVADGMGGHAAGEVASRLAVEAVADAVDADLEAALRSADARVIAEAEEHPEMEGMGTTLTLAQVVGPQLRVAHVGDSRLYLLRGGRLHQITHDHTLVAQMVEEGVISAAAAAQHPFRSVITNTVGGNESGIEVEQQRVDLAPGDVVLLCSDGLTEMLPDAEITRVLGAHADPQAATEALVQAANEAGGRDNVTVIVARIDAARM